MLDLGLSVLFASLLFVIFKLFAVYKIDTLYAIITNYVVAGTLGMLLYDGEVSFKEIPEKPWFLGTLALGILFIAVFNLMGKTAQVIGVATVSVITKMSLVVPVLFGLVVYNEHLSILKIIGILFALIAVYLASVKDKEKTITSVVSRKTWLLTIVLFMGSGLIDTSLKFIQEKYIADGELGLFSASVFYAAAAVGIIFILLRAIKYPLKINLRNIIGGIVLGIPNYFALYYLLKALDNKSINSASIFTINNVAVVLFSTLLGILLFKEKISLKNWGGIALAVISILLVALF